MNNRSSSPSEEDGSDVLDITLDGTSDIVALLGMLSNPPTVRRYSTCRQALHVRVDIYNSFSARWTEEEPIIGQVMDAIGALPNLERLEFYGLRVLPYRVPLSMIARILRLANKLQSLELVGLEFSGNLQQLVQFSDTFRQHPTLRRFGLDNCRLAEGDYENHTPPKLDESLIPALTEISTLRTLSIRAMAVSVWATLTAESVASLCASPNLHELELIILGQGEDHAGKMADALKEAGSLSQLQHLTLSGEWSGLDQGASSLARMLRHNTSLRSLDLHLTSRRIILKLPNDDSNDIEKDGLEDDIVELAQSLQSNKTLKHFHLYDAIPSNFGSRSRHSFVEMMQKNYSLTDPLRLFHTGFFQPESEFYAKLNRLGRGRLLLDKTITKRDWVEMLIQVKDDLSSLLYFMLRNPLLCCETVHMELSAADASHEKRGSCTGLGLPHQPQLPIQEKEHGRKRRRTTKSYKK